MTDLEFLTLPILAVVAGFVSFSSPCCLPLVPGYLSYVSALPVSDLGASDARRITVRASLLFVAGFSVVFTVLGVGASLAGSLFLRNQATVVRLFGIAIIVMRRNGRYIEIVGGAMLVVVGVLFVSGRWQPMFRPLQRWFAQLGWPPI